MKEANKVIRSPMADDLDRMISFVAGKINKNTVDLGISWDLNCFMNTAVIKQDCVLQ